MQRKGVAAPVHSLFRSNFPDVDLFASWRYVHVKEEGPEHRRELPVLHYHKIMVIYLYPFLVVISHFSPESYLSMIVYVY